MPSCLIVNPVSNANILVRYLKRKGVDCYAIIELEKVAQIPKLSSKKKVSSRPIYIKKYLLAKSNCRPSIVVCLMLFYQEVRMVCF